MKKLYSTNNLMLAAAAVAGGMAVSYGVGFIPDELPIVGKAGGYLKQGIPILGGHVISAYSPEKSMQKYFGVGMMAAGGALLGNKMQGLGAVTELDMIDFGDRMGGALNSPLNNFSSPVHTASGEEFI